jgi:hypothetical protein
MHRKKIISQLAMIEAVIPYRFWHPFCNTLFAKGLKFFQETRGEIGSRLCYPWM